MTHVVVPLMPTEAQWGGLARDIVFWWCMGVRPTGQRLFKHLGYSGTPIPDWLRKEIPDIDHVPPKGTVAAVIYRAMLEGAPNAIEIVEQVRTTELFEDGLSADLHSAGIRTLPAAYMAGRMDALEELQTTIKERTA